MKLTKEYVRDLEERLEDANYECDKLGGNADATFDLRGEVSRSEMLKVEEAEKVRDSLLEELSDIWLEHPELLSEDMQEYFAECAAEAAEYEAYEEEMRKRAEAKKAEAVKRDEVRPGDVIKAHGITAVIDRILYQEHHEGFVSRHYTTPEEWCVEFFDTNGNYRHYRSWLDGGEVILK